MTLYHDGDYLHGETVDNIDEIPDKKLERVTSNIRKMKCPACDENMYYVVVPGHNAESTCRHCKESFKIVG